MASSLVDTDILVYARDLREPVKRARAVEQIEQLSARGELVLSAQVLNEFSATALRLGMSVDEVRAAVARWSELASRLLPLQSDATAAALDGVQRHGLAFWDALIWVTARESGIPVVVSEDFQHGREIEGVSFENPFADL
jgi:predicted nucleic acid-binding protein